MLAGPSGSGKSTLLNLLIDMYPHLLAESKSYTTRYRRPGEREMRSYHFVDKKNFDETEANDEFIETTLFSGSGYQYGTLAYELEMHWRRGFGVIIAVDTHGVDNYFDLNLKPKVIFLDCTSDDEIRRRLRNGDRQDSEEQIEKRVAKSHEEREWAMHAAADGKILYVPDPTIAVAVQTAIGYFGLPEAA